MGERIRILIADDHPMVREGLAAVLNQEEDLEVVGQAGNGVEAVSLAKELRPDVVLMDLQMPQMDGVEAIKRIKEDSPETGVIILTTYDTDEHIFSGIRAGARAFLLKDALPSEVLQAIRLVSRGESLIQPRVASRVLDRVSELAEAPTTQAVLSPRETEVLQLMVTGAANKEIAAQLVIGESTVKTHIIRIFDKLGVKSRTEAVAEGARRGIVHL